MKYLLALLPFCLFASINQPLRVELFSGYRNDTLHWHTDSQNEDYENIQFWQNGLKVRSVQRDIVFNAEGSYSAFGKGTLNQIDVQGYAADGTGHFGYAANLTPDRTYKAIVIPLVGFSGHYEKLSFYSQTLYGPCLGGAIQVEPGNRMVFEVGYAFNWLRLRAKADSFKFKGWGNYGHSGWVQLDFVLARDWRVGLLGQIDYIYTNVHEQQFKLRWTPISGSFVLSKTL